MTILRTWPYGTKHRGRVLRTEKQGNTSAQFVEDLTAKREGHILVGSAGDRTANDGDEGDLVFMQGGPTGGYWKFTKDAGH